MQTSEIMKQISIYHSLSPSVDFTNVLQAASAGEDSKSRLTLIGSLFVLLGSAFVKALHKHLAEIDSYRLCHRFGLMKWDHYCL
jgi:hypothetical protein